MTPGLANTQGYAQEYFPYVMQADQGLGASATGGAGMPRLTRAELLEALATDLSGLRAAQGLPHSQMNVRPNCQPGKQLAACAVDAPVMFGSVQLRPPMHDFPGSFPPAQQRLPRMTQAQQVPMYAMVPGGYPPSNSRVPVQARRPDFLQHPATRASLAAPVISSPDLLLSEMEDAWGRDECWMATPVQDSDGRVRDSLAREQEGGLEAEDMEQEDPFEFSGDGDSQMEGMTAGEAASGCSMGLHCNHQAGQTEHWQGGAGTPSMPPTFGEHARDPLGRERRLCKRAADDLAEDFEGRNGMGASQVHVAVAGQDMQFALRGGCPAFQPMGNGSPINGSPIKKFRCHPQDSRAFSGEARMESARRPAQLRKWATAGPLKLQNVAPAADVAPAAGVAHAADVATGASSNRPPNSYLQKLHLDVLMDNFKSHSCVTGVRKLPLPRIFRQNVAAPQ